MRNKKQILNESAIDSQYNTQLILEVLLDIRDLSVPVEPSKPSEEEKVRADERRVLREKLLDTELHYKDWTSKEGFFSREDIDNLLK